MENKLRFEDGLTWEYEWDRYDFEVDSWFQVANITDPVGQWSTKWPFLITGKAPTELYLYTSTGWEMTSESTIALAGVTSVGWSTNLSGKLWFISSVTNLRGSVNFSLSSSQGKAQYLYYSGSQCCWGYGGEIIIREASGSNTKVRVVLEDSVYTLCDFQAYYYLSPTPIRSTNKKAHPANGQDPNNSHRWWTLTKYPDNIELTNSDLYGGVNFEHVLNSEENITVGQIATAKIEFETYVLNTSFVGRQCIYSIKQNNDGNTWRQIGIFNVVKAERLNTNGRYRITAYDNTYKLNTIIDDWLYHTDCYANRYHLFDSGLSRNGGTTNSFRNNWSGSPIILAVGLKIEYNPSSTWNADIWKFKGGQPDTDILTIYDDVSQSEIDRYNEWLTAHRGQVIFDVAYWDGQYARLNAFRIWTSAAISIGSSNSCWVRANGCRSTTLPYRVWTVTGTYFDDLGSAGPFYTATDTQTYGNFEYLQDISSSTFCMCTNSLHREPILVNGETTPRAVLSSICSDLGLTSGGFDRSPLSSLVLSFGFTATNITATLMLGYLAEVLAGYVYATNLGYIKIGAWRHSVSTVKTLNNTQYTKYNFSDEDVLVGTGDKPSVKLTIKRDESDVGITRIWNPVDGNNASERTVTPRSTYVITKNPWTLDSSGNINTTIFGSFFDNYSLNIQDYTPMTIECLEDFKINVGDRIMVNNKYTYVFAKRMNNNGVTFESTGNNEAIDTRVAQIESLNAMSGKAINLQSYTYNNDTSAGIKVNGEDGSIYITTGAGGHVYINGVQIDT